MKFFKAMEASFKMNFEDGNRSFCLSEESGRGCERRRKRVRFLTVCFLSLVCSDIHKVFLIKSVSRNPNASQEHRLVFHQLSI